MLVLLLLSALATVAAAAVAVRWYGSTRGDRTLATMLWALGIVILPIHGLGWLNVLTRINIALGVAGTSVAVLAFTWRGPERRRYAVETLRMVVSLACLPRDALRLAFRARSFSLVGLVTCIVLLGWATVLTWLVPSGSWDGLTYHEPIAYYALQMRGFHLVEVDSTAISQQINSAPRVGHCLLVYFAAFGGRTFIELPSVLMSVYLLVGFYQIARRFTDPVTAMGHATALFLVPTLLLQLRTTLQDSSFAAIFVVAAHYATRPRLRPRDIWPAALALGLMGGFKFTGVVLVPAYGAVLLLRAALASRGERKVRWALPLLGGTLLIALLVLPTYVRNLQAFGNPLWPRTFAFPSIGIEFKGIFQPYHLKSLDATLGQIFSPPVDGRQFPDTRDNGYGNGPPFVIFPLCAAAWIALLFHVPVSLIRKKPMTAETWSLLALAVPAFGVLPLSPSFFWARYTVYAIAAGWAMVVWLLRAPRWRSFSQAVAGSMIVTGIMTFAWSSPGWGCTVSEALRLVRMSPAERATPRLTGNFSLHEPIARLRAQEIRAGDVVAYSAGDFIGTLWNEELSNEVRYLRYRRSPEVYLAELDRMRAKWVMVFAKHPAERAVKASKSWELLGDVHGKKQRNLVYGRRLPR